MLMPSWRGWLALAMGFAVAIVVPPLIPAYDGPGISIFQIAVAVLTAVVTALICIRGFLKGRTADRVVVFLTAVFAAWIFYEFIHRIAYQEYGMQLIRSRRLISCLLDRCPSPGYVWALTLVPGNTFFTTADTAITEESETELDRSSPSLSGSQSVQFMRALCAWFGRPNMCSVRTE